MKKIKSQGAPFFIVAFDGKNSAYTADELATWAVTRPRAIGTDQWPGPGSRSGDWFSVCPHSDRHFRFRFHARAPPRPVIFTRSSCISNYSNVPRTSAESHGHPPPHLLLSFIVVSDFHSIQNPPIHPSHGSSSFSRPKNVNRWPKCKTAYLHSAVSKLDSKQGYHHSDFKCCRGIIVFRTWYLRAEVLRQYVLWFSVERKKKKTIWEKIRLCQILLCRFH